MKPRGLPNGHANGILAAGGTESSRIPVPTRGVNSGGGNGPMVIVNSPDNGRRGPSPMFKQALESRNGEQVEGKEGLNWTDLVAACKQQAKP